MKPDDFAFQFILSQENEALNNNLFFMSEQLREKNYSPELCHMA